jgi:hypothetical protein
MLRDHIFPFAIEMVAATHETTLLCDSCGNRRLCQAAWVLASSGQTAENNAWMPWGRKTDGETHGQNGPAVLLDADFKTKLWRQDRRIRLQAFKGGGN